MKTEMGTRGTETVRKREVLGKMKTIQFAKKVKKQEML